MIAFETTDPFHSSGHVGRNYHSQERVMAGGRSAHNSGQKWEEKEQTAHIHFRHSHLSVLGLYRARDTLMAQLQDLNKSKPRSKVDENLIGKISRLESAITVTRDDLVSVSCYHRSMHSSNYKYFTYFSI